VTPLTAPAGNAVSQPSTHPAAFPRLGPTDVHVWRASVAEYAPHEEQMATLLDETERARAGRFHFARDRQRHVVAHAMLRLLLGRYAGRPAAAIEFTFGPAGKPALRGNEVSSSPQFNLSHSGDIVLVAVTRESAVGIDVEQHSPDVECEALVEHFFSPAECAEFRGLRREARRAAFFACWSRKEAYIKATGLGVSAGLDYFDVTVDPALPAQLIADRQQSPTDRRWQMHDLIAGTGYSASIVLDASVAQVEQFAFVPSHWAAGPGGEP